MAWLRQMDGITTTNILIFGSLFLILGYSMIFAASPRGSIRSKIYILTGIHIAYVYSLYYISTYKSILPVQEVELPY